MVQREISESMEDCVSYDKGESEGGRTNLVGSDMVEGMESSVVFSDGGTFAGEGSRSGLGIVASDIADANTVRSESVGACPSFSVEDVQFACTDAEADQMVYEGGSEVATIL